MEVGCGRTAHILKDRKQSTVETEKDDVLLQSSLAFCRFTCSQQPVQTIDED